jgi:hypothetical protein
MLADAATNTLWTCQPTPVPGATTVKRHTALRSFDLETGKQKIRWNLPGDNSTCNHGLPRSPGHGIPNPDLS